MWIGNIKGIENINMINIGIMIVISIIMEIKHMNRVGIRLSIWLGIRIVIKNVIILRNWTMILIEILWF